MNYINENQNQPEVETKKGMVLTRGKVALLLVLNIVIAIIMGLSMYLVTYQFGAPTNIIKKDFSGNYLSPQHVIDDCAQSIVMIEVSTPLGEGAGSGVIISEDGYILTNQHVVDSADKIKITTQDEKSFDVEVIEENARKDLALVKVKNAKDEEFIPATLGNPQNTKIGDTAIVLGNPLGLGISASQGIISATGRTVDSQMEYFQIDAAVNPGNSGGGLFNIKGELIGIVNMKLGGELIDGIGFAIPLDEATKYLEKANADISGLTKEEDEETNSDSNSNSEEKKE